MTHQTPKAFDFGEQSEPPLEPVNPAATPRAFDFGDVHAASAAPAASSPPKPFSFDDLDTAQGAPGPGPKASRLLFDSEDHPALRDAMALAWAEYPALAAHAQQRLSALFRRILPLKLSLVTDWAQAPLSEQAALLQPITELVLKFTQMGVPALLEAALESTRPPSGMIGRLLRRSAAPAEYTPALTSARTQLLQLMADSELATRKLEESAQSLRLHAVVLAVASTLAGDSPDATLLDALLNRRTLIQQAVRQAELSILQMGQVREQAAHLIGQIASFLTVTLPALEMAQAQRGS